LGTPHWEQLSLLPTPPEPPLSGKTVSAKIKRSPETGASPGLHTWGRDGKKGTKRDKGEKTPGKEGKRDRGKMGQSRWNQVGSVSTTQSRRRQEVIIEKVKSIYTVKNFKVIL
jgi:hypothetical protein